MFFDSWTDILNILVVGTLAYIGLVALLRVSGKRTLSKMNAFDFIVTVALGSTLASTILSKDTTLIEGLVAFALLAGLQFIVTWASVRSEQVRKFVKAEPALLFHRGSFLWNAMQRERVTRDEVLAAIREQGSMSLEQIDGVILETDGTLTVVQGSQDSKPTALSNVTGYTGVVTHQKGTTTPTR